MSVAPGQADQEINLPRGRPRTGPDRAPARQPEAAIEADQTAEVINDRDRWTNLGAIHLRIRAEKPLEVQGDQIERVRLDPARGWSTDPDR